MTETLNVKISSTGEELRIADVEPTESAKLFLQVSDEIWRQKPESIILNSHSLPVEMPAEEALDGLNEVLGEIDEKLVISAARKSIKLRGREAEDLKLSPESFTSPESADVGTFNWDNRNTWRYANINGKEVGVEFTDGHTDYYRELYAHFNFKDEARNLVQLRYSMQRIQYTQDQPTLVYMSLWHSSFAETGYEGHQLEHTPLDVKQELRLLNTLKSMGGISLAEDGFAQ